MPNTGAVGRIEVYPLRKEDEHATAAAFSGPNDGRYSKSFKDKLELRFRVFVEEALPLIAAPAAAVDLPDAAEIAALHPKVVKKEKAAPAADHSATTKPAAKEKPAKAAEKATAAYKPLAAAPAAEQASPSIIAAVIAPAAAATEAAPSAAAALDARDCSPGAVEADDGSAVAHHGGEGQVVTPWEVSAEEGIDYDKLIRDFGCSRITEDVISRVERLTNRRAHRFLRRGLFFSHRDLTELLDAYERGQPFYLYTGEVREPLFPPLLGEIRDVPVCTLL